MQILLLDIELAPTVAHVWQLYEPRIAPSQVMVPGHMLCWSAKWYRDKEIGYSGKNREPKRMVKRIHKLLDQADVVVHYNGKKFDIPHLNREFILAGLTPPSPYKQVDLYQVVRRQFRFASNKLDYVCQQLGLGNKVRHPGHEMWVRAMLNEPEAWEQMEKYNRGDVSLLEKLYDRLMPWIPNHPNHGSYSEPGEPVCPACGSTALRADGYARTPANKYVRYRCGACGYWSREPFSRTTKADRGVLMRSIAG